MFADMMRRLIIVAFLALFIGVLFIGTAKTFAETRIDEQYKHMNTVLWPTEGEITDTFGTRAGKHFGIDIAAPEGQIVVSVADGKVMRSYYSHSYGHVIFIEHDNGLETIYAHLHDRYVQENEEVVAGQEIGTVGNTGRSTGNHLHFEVHEGNWNMEKSNSIDPLLVLGEEPRFFVMAEKEAVETINERLEEETEDNRESLTVTIKRGDTLSHIARDYGVSVEQLKAWNGLTSDLIRVNETLIVELIEKATLTDKLEAASSGTSRQYKSSIQQLIEQNNRLANRLLFPSDLLLLNGGSLPLT